MTSILRPRRFHLALTTGVALSLLLIPRSSTPANQDQAMTPLVDYARLDLHGDGMSKDSVSLAVVAAARLLGLEVDYETVFCQSGTAFAPSIDLQEDCTSHWHVCAWHATAGLSAVARRLGLRIEPLPVPALADTEAMAALAHRRRVAGIVRHAMDRGQVVLVPGGWNLGLDPPGPHGFVHWGMMGIVTEADPATGRLLGAHLNGHRDNLIDQPGQFWAVTRSDGPAAVEEADLAMLRLAVDRIRGEGVFARSERVVNGLEAMDAWIGQMRRVPGFCSSCFAKIGSSTGDAPNNARRMSAGAQAAAGQLRRIAGSSAMTPAACDLLESTATRYDRIAILLQPALTGQGGPGYAEFIGDLERQQAHAEQVLVPIKAELAAAVEELEQAVVAMTVRRADGKVWVEGLPPAPGPGDGYIRGLESILAQQSLPVSYDRLMALSGRAFIVQADVEHRWEGKVDVGWWPLDVWGLELRREFLGQAVGCELTAAGAINLTAEEFTQIRDRLPAWYREQVQPQVIRSIDAGRPVLALSDWGFVVTGYDDVADLPPVLGRCGRETKPGQDRCGSWPTGVLLPGRRILPLETRAADVAALQHAVALAHDQAGPFEPQWRDRRFTGQKALTAWASLLRHETEPVEDRHHANMQYRLIDCRQAAVRYLDNLADREEGEAAKGLHQAAGAYGKGIELLSQVRCEGLATSQDQRRELADLVDRLAAEELRAADYLEQSLAAMGAAPSTAQ
ncbi:MAG: hypothetical protein WDA75_24585 [Candidatus Latescibacterota bacterium]|jgi:hypothetical protein